MLIMQNLSKAMFQIKQIKATLLPGIVITAALYLCLSIEMLSWKECQKTVDLFSDMTC